MSILNYKNLPNPNDVIDKIKQDGYIVCNDAIEINTFRKIQNYWINRFKKIDQKKLKEYHRNFIYRLGEKNLINKTTSKDDFRLKIHEFLWNNIEENTRSLITEMHKFSNLCKKINEDDGLIYSNKKNVLSLSVNYYPPKDGYLSKHKDVKNTDLIFWMIFNLTFKDEHFEKGGLYLINKNGEKIDLETLSKPGSIIFFNGALDHGIDQILSKNNIGKLSVFPFNTNFYNQETIPNSIKFLMKVYDKIAAKINPNKKVERGLNY